VSAREIDVTPACRQMLSDIAIRPRAASSLRRDFRKCAGGARTSLLFRLANHHDALVLGTGDLSELRWLVHLWRRRSDVALQRQRLRAKTLIQHLIRWCARDARFAPIRVSADIFSQRKFRLSSCQARRRSARRILSSYALQDFNLYYTTATASRLEDRLPRDARLARRRRGRLAFRRAAGQSRRI